VQRVEEVIQSPRIQRPPQSKAGVVVLLAIVAAVLVLPIWIVQYPPLLDYPNHLARSFVLSHLHDGAYQFARYYHANWGPYPYLSMDFLLIALQQIFPIAVAGKVFLSLCLIGVPLACWWFVRQANPGNDWIAFWGLLVAFNQFFLESFLAFQLGVIACFVMLGFWLRWTPKITLRRWLILLLLTTLIYFSHLIGFILAGFVVTMYSLFARRGLRELLASWLLFLPGCILYPISGLGTHNGTFLHFRAADDKWDEFIHILFGGYSHRLTSATAWIALACLAVAWIRNRNFRWNWRWIFVALLALGLYIALPYSYGETFDIDVRVLPIFFVLMFAVADFGARRAKIIGAVALVLFGLRAVTIVRTFRSEQPELQAISRGVALMKPNSLMLTIVEPRHEHDPNRWPYEHFWAWAVIERGAFSPYLFDLPGQTPMRIIYDSYTPDGFWDSEYEDGDVDWEKVQKQYDYVWLYNVNRYAPKLDKIGTCVSQFGDFRLYRVRRTL
jgi:hypothetical protein